MDVIYQGTFFDGSRFGRADFLRKVDAPSDLGAWSYEVWDTKLARRPTGSAVLQLCFYSDLLREIQGTLPEQMYLALGGAEAPTVAFPMTDYAAYYRLVAREFELLVKGGEAVYPPITLPDPVEHCHVCRWSETCRNERRAADDLSLVAGITTRQRRVLRERGIGTRAGLGSLAIPVDPPLRGTSPGSVHRVREQARIQVEGTRAGRVLSERLAPTRLKDGQLEPNRGLLSLPEPSKGDLYFDIEGDPFALDEGVDYLFGVIEPSRPDEDGQPTFHRFWSIDSEDEVTPRAERQAFEALIDLVMDRLAADPNLHVYHYAPYEPSAVQRLMGRYATREDEVDQLLRAGVFVDLFRAARQGIRASVESYSIKQLEPLYGFDRTVDLRDAGSSIVAFETWLELGGEVDDDPAILERIAGYNRDDCVSNWMLRDWLEGQRSALEQELGDELPRPRVESGEPSGELAEGLADVAALVEQLCLGVPDDVADRSEEEHARWLLAQLLRWRRREAKSGWWRYFHLKEDLTEVELIGESDALAGLVAEGLVGKVRRSEVYRFSFPEQEHKIEVGSRPHDPRTGDSAGRVEAVSDEEGWIELSVGAGRAAPEATALIPFDDVRTDGLRSSLRRFASWVVANGMDGPGQYHAARELLMRRPPTAGCGADGLQA